MINEILEQLSQISKTTEKKELLRANDSEELRDFLYLAYNPFIQFGVSDEIADQLLASASEDGVKNDQYVKGILEDLSSGNLSGNRLMKYLHVIPALHPDCRSLLLKVLAKDLRCGIGAKTINKVFHNLVPSFEPMLVVSFDADKWKKFPCLIETKLDGVRVMAFCRANGEIEIKSREAKPFPAFDFMKDQIRMVHNEINPNKDIILDGEVKGKTFQHTISISRRLDADATEATYYIFDVVEIPDDQTIEEVILKGKQDAKLSDRKSRLEQVENSGVFEQTKNLTVVEYSVANSIQEIMDAFVAERKRGEEGIIVKDPNSPYVFKRSNLWQRIKDQETHDLRVIDLQEGTGKYKGKLGAAIVDFNGVEVSVGSGFTDNQREIFWNHPELIMGKIIEVISQEKTRDKSLRHTRFSRIRDDKSEE